MAFLPNRNYRHTAHRSLPEFAKLWVGGNSTTAHWRNMKTDSLDESNDASKSHAPKAGAPRATLGVWRFAAEVPVGQYAIPHESPLPEAVAGSMPGYRAPNAESFANPNSASAVDYDAPLMLAPNDDVAALATVTAAPSKPDRIVVPPDPSYTAAFEYAARPDLLMPRASRDSFTQEDSWVDLWGFRAVVLGFGAGVIALVVAGGMWLSEPREDKGSLAALSARPQAAVAVPAAPVSADKPVTPAPPVLPPAVTMPAPVMVASPSQPVPPIATPEPAAPTIAEVEPKAEVPVALPAKPRSVPRRQQPKAVAAVKPKPARLVRRSDRQGVPVAAVAAPRPIARAARAPRVAKVSSAPPVSAQERLLKECRAYGYQGDQCVKRGCVLTKFGLACKGK